MRSYSVLAITTVAAPVLVSAAPVRLIGGPVESVPVSSHMRYPASSGLHRVRDDELFELLAREAEVNEAQHATTGAPQTNEHKLGEHGAAQTGAHSYHFATNSEHEHPTSEESARHGAAHSHSQSGKDVAAHSRLHEGEHTAAQSHLQKGRYATAHSHPHKGEHALTRSHLHSGEHASKHVYSKSGKSTHRYGKNAKGKYTHKGVGAQHAAYNGLKAHKGGYAAHGGEHVAHHTGEHSNEYGASAGNHAHPEAQSAQREHEHGPPKTGAAHSSESSIPTMHQHEARGTLSKASHLLNHVSNGANAVSSIGDAWQSVKQAVHHRRSPEPKSDKLHNVGKAAGVAGDVVTASSSVAGAWQSFHSREGPYEFLYERDYELDDLE
ncbi:hypothetical protein DAEQUDRAFT_318320 [Daedalea quercina L-15889]|uniref:Uncharacterized protein n=1 Tax=Daedalea quercina L-15889 TaxID=1314783 RepID=A0A165PWY2_9APHY|nr:hypothetical protein DAEQUDRAFT_318320 [Daedalea quercina L-15889]